MGVVEWYVSILCVSNLSDVIYNKQVTKWKIALKLGLTNVFSTIYQLRGFSRK